MTQETQNTEEKILEAARTVFIKKGLKGARMQEIADEANINKAMLHYYFRNKEKLFEKIFTEAMKKIIPGVNQIFDADTPLFTKIENFVDQYINIIQQNPHLPAFIIHELNQDPQKILVHMENAGRKPNPDKFFKQIQAEVNAGNIRQVHPVHLIVNIISMCIFPFLAQPVIQGVLEIPDKEYQSFLDNRKSEIVQFVINSLKL